VRKRAVKAGVAIAALTGGFALAVASAADKPTYFVDGAVATGGVQSDSHYSGCVPYSEDRPGAFVCDPDAPKDYSPVPRPYYDKSICDLAIEWLEERQESSLIDASSCLVQESQNANYWLILFKSQDGEGAGIHVPYDPTGENTQVAHP